MMTSNVDDSSFATWCSVWITTYLTVIDITIHYDLIQEAIFAMHGLRHNLQQVHEKDIISSNFMDTSVNVSDLWMEIAKCSELLWLFDTSSSGRMDHVTWIRVWIEDGQSFMSLRRFTIMDDMQYSSEHFQRLFFTAYSLKQMPWAANLLNQAPLVKIATTQDYVWM